MVINLLCYLTKMTICYHLRLWTVFQSGDIVDITTILLKTLDAVSLTTTKSDNQQLTTFDNYVASLGMLNSIILDIALESQLLIQVSQDLRKGPLNIQVHMVSHFLLNFSNDILWTYLRSCSNALFVSTSHDQQSTFYRENAQD